jgi:hypothetical protein
MSTASKTKNKAFDFTSASFEDIINQDEKDLNKKISNDQKRQGKMIQMTGKINELHMRIMKSETEFQKSMTDPTKDSVEIGIQIKCDREELAFAVELFGQLFPKNKNQIMLIGSGMKN